MDLENLDVPDMLVSSFWQMEEVAIERSEEVLCSFCCGSLSLAIVLCCVYYTLPCVHLPWVSIVDCMLSNAQDQCYGLIVFVH